MNKIIRLQLLSFTVLIQFSIVNMNARDLIPNNQNSKCSIILEEFVFEKSPTRDCHASSILELKNGDLLCSWFGGTRESASDVKIWLSRKPKGGKWSNPEVVVDLHGKRYIIQC